MVFWKKTKKEKYAPDAGPSDAVDSVRRRGVPLRGNGSRLAAETDMPQEPEKVMPSASPPARKITGILKGSHLTEKTSDGAEKGVYTFRVSSAANKIRVREAVRREYGVAVSVVRMLNTKEKARVRGRIVGWKRGFKKAMVTLQEGHKIEIQ